MLGVAEMTATCPGECTASFSPLISRRARKLFVRRFGGRQTAPPAVDELAMGRGLCVLRDNARRDEIRLVPRRMRRTNLPLRHSTRKSSARTIRRFHVCPVTPFCIRIIYVFEGFGLIAIPYTIIHCFTKNTLDYF